MRRRRRYERHLLHFRSHHGPQDAAMSVKNWISPATSALNARILRCAKTFTRHGRWFPCRRLPHLCETRVERARRRLVVVLAEGEFHVCGLDAKRSRKYGQRTHGDSDEGTARK
jgi:hypothetical protein